MPDESLNRSADVRANSYDPETRTFTAVIATETPVRRADQLGPYDEVLPVAAFDLRRQNLPVLDSHNTASVRATLGRTLSIRSEGNELVADIRLSSADDVALVGQRIADGTLTGLSIGYRPAGWKTQTTTAGRVKRATGVTLTEVTLTSNPADPNAGVRHNPEALMAEETITTPSAEEAERTRRSEIRTLVRTAGLGPALADQLIDDDVDLTAAKAAVFDAMQARNASRPVIRVHGGGSEDPAVTRERMAEALHVRMAGGEPPAEVRAFMGQSMLDMARGSLARAGISTRGMTPDETFQRAGDHTTSDFPLLVSSAMGKTALASYKAAESPLKQLGRQVSLSNFKSSTALRLGEMGRLEELDESGEITATSRAESGESMNLKTYARGISVSRKLLIDDDLGMLGDMVSAFGEAAAQTEADVMVDLIVGNPNLSDGAAVFSTERGNEASTGNALGDAGAASGLAAARLHFRQLVGLDGETLISVPPKFLLCGPESETDAEMLLASIYPATTADVNAFTSKFTLLVEPRITGNSWYIFSDPARLAAIRYGYLSSAQGVQIQRQDSWTTLGMSFRAFLDFGAGWLDWRAAYLNPGS